MQLFYAPDFPSDNCLPQDESHHCIKVLRHIPGDTITVTNGNGLFFKTEIVEDNPKKCRLHIIDEIVAPPVSPVRIHIAIAPVKNMKRFEWFLEKATEVGVTSITPLICARSERTKFNRDREEKILISAMKQSLKAVLPELREQIKLSDFCKEEFHGRKMIAHLTDVAKPLQKELSPGEDVLVLIGPEGDFTENEIEFALQNDYIPITLGKHRLRTETAGVVACTIIQMLNE